jgi:hypothetical protein
MLLEEKENVTGLINEGNELAKIIAKSVVTSKRNQSQKISQRKTV